MPDGRAARVWIVEDNADDAMFIRSAFQRCAPAIVLNEFADGDAALQAIRAIPPRDRPHVILLDLNLPTRDGHEILADLKNDPELRDIPVIVLTASRSERDLKRSYALHANAHVTKPNDFREYEAFARSLCAFWLSWVGTNPNTLISRAG